MTLFIVCWVRFHARSVEKSVRLSRAAGISSKPQVSIAQVRVHNSIETENILLHSRTFVSIQISSTFEVYFQAAIVSLSLALPLITTTSSRAQWM